MKVQVYFKFASWSALTFKFTKIGLGFFELGIFWIVAINLHPQKSNMDTHDTNNCHLFKGVHPFQPIILDIHVSFRGCNN